MIIKWIKCRVFKRHDFGIWNDIRPSHPSPIRCNQCGIRYVDVVAYMWWPHDW